MSVMMLGDVLREARHAAAVIDPALRAEIEAAGQTPPAFARAAVTLFERYASEEDWATMLSAIRSAPDPGKTCLETMVRWQLRRSTARRATDAIADKRDTDEHATNGTAAEE